MVITLEQDLWHTIAIMIALDSLQKDFDITTTSLLETGDKTIDQIQSILQLKEAKNLGKRVTKSIRDLVIAFLDKKKKANTNNKCYNCHKLGHFSQNCPLSDKRLNRIQNLRNSRSRSSSERGSQTQTIIQKCNHECLI